MILDILCIGIIGVSILVCFRRGFVMSLFSALSAAATLIVMTVFYKPFVAAVKSSPLGISLTESFRRRVADMLTGTAGDAIASSTAPGFIKDIMRSGTQSAGDAAAACADRSMEVLIAVVTFVALMLILKILLRLVPGIIRTVTRLPVVHQADKLLGLGIGVILGFVWVVVAVYCAGLLSLAPSFEFLDAQIADSFFLDLINSIEIGFGAI